MVRKKPRIGTNNPEKVSLEPSSNPVPQNASSEDRCINFRLSKLDIDCEYSLTKLNYNDAKNAFRRLGSCEGKTIKELRAEHEIFKSYDLDALPPGAEFITRRLCELDIDDEDKIYRIRATGSMRIYGVLNGNDFYLLWFDPNHKIYPSKKKHT